MFLPCEFCNRNQGIERVNPATSQVRGSMGGPEPGSAVSGLKSPSSKTSAPIAVICARTAAVVISSEESERVPFEWVISYIRARGAPKETEDSTESFGTFCVE